MKKSSFFLLAAFASLPCLVSCIQDEPLNAECDIIDVEQSWVDAHPGLLIGNPRVENTRVAFTIQPGSDRTALNPRFELTPGATITMKENGVDIPANGVTRDFSSPQTYTVHSQDGFWKKDYEVSFSPRKSITKLNFENFRLDATGRYYEWYEVDTDELGTELYYWATGNAGYAITGMGNAPDDYPSNPDAHGVSNENGTESKCIRLETRATGSFGERLKMPLAAGNIFIGEFASTQAAMYPRRATKFGLQLVTEVPVKLEGYYKYKAGETFIDINKVEHPELHDMADIYAVVYEAYPEGSDKFVPLNGDDVLSSDRIVLLARIDEPGEPEKWTFFSEPFKPVGNKGISEEMLRENKYAIAIVCTSSRDGAYFNGAIGSVLYVDELKVVWKGDE